MASTGLSARVGVRGWRPDVPGLVEQARGALQVAQSQLSLACNGVTNDVAQGLRQPAHTRRKLRLSNVAVATAQENLRLSQGRYWAGLELAIDVLDGGAALLSVADHPGQSTSGRRPGPRRPGPRWENPSPALQEVQFGKLSCGPRLCPHMALGKTYMGSEEE